jgi:hypothetical protein
VHHDVKCRAKLEYEGSMEKACALQQEGNIVEIHEWVGDMVSDP